MSMRRLLLDGKNVMLNYLSMILYGIILDRNSENSSMK